MFDPYALFPFEQVDKNSRVIIYGAGRAGNNFMQQATVAGYCKVVAIVDKDTKKHNNIVTGLDILLNLSFYDCVVISPTNFALRKRIYDDLVNFGIPKERIIVPSTDNLLYWSLDGMIQSEQGKLSAVRTDAVSMDAKMLVSSKRLDIGIKWLLIRDLANNVANDVVKSLYARHILAYTYGKESFFPTSGTIKDGVEEYLQSAEKILASIKANGFDKNNPVPISNGNVLDGAHRVASCIETDVPIWVRRYPGLDYIGKDFAWYQSNGFSSEDIQRILRAFCEIYPRDAGMLCFYGTAVELWEFMQKQLAAKVNIVGYLDLDFESNYIAFEALLNDIYFFNYGYGDDHIDAKISLLKLAPLKIRVFVVSDEGIGDGEDLYGILREFKLKMREVTFAEFQDIELQVHSTDSLAEFIHLKEVLLSPNNLKYLGYRFRPNYTKRFIYLLDRLKTLCKTRGVPVSDVCVVNSCIMEVLGLRESKDLDFVCLQSKLPRFSDISRLSDTAELRSDTVELRDNLMKQKFCGISTDTMITDDNYHFIFYGVKFANLEIVRAKKAEHNREKDRDDVRLIDLFHELVMVYEEKAALKKGVYDEMIRRRLNRLDIS